MKKVNKKNHYKLSFGLYLSICLGIISLILLGLTYFINLLPIDYFIVLSVLIIIFDVIFILLLKSKSTIKNVIGILLSLILMVVMVLGINYELGTIAFFESFGASNIKVENYNIYVLDDSEYQKLKNLKGELIGHLDKDEDKALSEVLEKLDKKVNFRSKEYEDISHLVNSLIKKETAAIILTDAQEGIFSEDDYDTYKFLRKIDTIEYTEKLDAVGSSVDIVNEPFNIYISGIDTYGKINKVSRSDVNIVATVNPKTKKILLTNIPRDYYVLLHKHNGYDKLTHAGIYGIDESVGTIEDLLDIKINYYVKVNFTSLEKIVDALGGIKVNSNYTFTSQDGYHYKKGENTLNGKEALSFARERKSFKEGDRVRGENQQIILSAIINKVMSPNLITKYNELLKSVKGNFVTNVTDKEITSFVKAQIDDLQPFDITSISLNGTDALDYTYSYKKNKLYVMKPDKDTINIAKEKISETFKK